MRPLDTRRPRCAKFSPEPTPSDGQVGQFTEGTPSDMDMKYLAYCFADPHFYDEPRAGGANGRQKQFLLPHGHEWTPWEQKTVQGWHYVMARGYELSEQGWKIHVSATLDNAQELLHKVAAYCGQHGISFKFLPTVADLVRANMKYAPRGGSGKFITIYPVDEEACETTAANLDDLVGGMEGPYILSDVRYRQGPLYLRYGGFRPMFVRGEMDEMVPAVRRPDGQLEPDERQPVFRPPAWVEVPEFVASQVRALGEDERPDEFPYKVVSGVHFSNGGGIYRATSTKGGHEVILKEGRPHAGISPTGVDAVERVRREVEFLTLLDDVDSVVNLLDTFSCAGHEFLVEEVVEGATLNSEIVRRNPLIIADATREDRLEYRDWCLNVLQQVESTVREFHRRGIIFGDLHPNNIMITPEGRARFIDFEMAYRVDERDVTPAGAPGFMAEDGRTGMDADLYSLGCTKLGLFLPLTVLLPLDPSTLRPMIDWIVKAFELSQEFADSIAADVALPDGSDFASPHAIGMRDLRSMWPVGSSDGLARVEKAIADGLDDNLDLSRSDRLYPGDISQFREGGYGIATGASGVLLSHPDAYRLDDALDWVAQAARNTTQPAFGFYDGMAGAAWTLKHFGRHEQAHTILDRVLGTDVKQLTSDLYSGLAGIGTMLMEWDAPGVPDQFAENHEQIRQEMARRLEEPRDNVVRQVRGQATVAVGRGGLMRGMTGQSLYWIRSFERTRDAADLARAQVALQGDLDLLVEAHDGSLQLNEGWRVLPYLNSGAMGVGLGIIRLLEHVQRDDLVDTLHGIERNLGPAFAVQSNVFNGRAGFVYYALRAGRDDVQPRIAGLDEAKRQVELLQVHAMVRKVSLTFPGEQLMRLSSDWSSGAAGVLGTLRLLRAALGETVNSRFKFPMLGVDPLNVDTVDVLRAGPLGASAARVA